MNSYVNCFVHVLDLRLLLFFYGYFLFLWILQVNNLLSYIIFTVSRDSTKYPNHIKDNFRIVIILCIPSNKILNIHFRVLKIIDFFYYVFFLF